jgi:hypothetical protein
MKNKGAGGLVGLMSGVALSLNVAGFPLYVFSIFAHQPSAPTSWLDLWPDIFEKAWGWERLLPYEIGTAHIYLDYLKEYHRRNSMDYVAAAANGNNPKPEKWPLKARPVDDVTGCSRNGENALAAAAKFVSSRVPLLNHIIYG